MEHHPVAHINPHMGHRAGAVIGSREKDNVAGLCLGGRNDSTLVVNALRRGTGQVEEGIVIGADTVVSIDGKILGKPADTEEAREMIHKLQGKSHMVYTGVTVIVKSDETVSASSFAEGTKVNVAPMTEDEIEAYISTSEPYDKAGAYGIQGLFGKFIEGIEGDYFNVVGLPVHRLYEELKKID